MYKGKWKKTLNVMMSAGLIASLTISTVPSKAVAANASDLIISEYIEGSSFNKVIEIYNGTGQTIDLSAYSLELYANGSATASQTLTLSGTLDNGKTYVIYHGSAVADIQSKGDLSNSTVINFNGDDALVLKNAETVIDSFGQVGVDPGSSWGSDDVTTVDHTLIRNSSVITGDTNPTDAFNPTNEWTALPKDDFSNLKTHTINGTTPPVATKVEAVTASTPSSSVAAGTAITLTTKTADAKIYYTTDGSEPTTSSALYTEPIIIDKDMTIKTLAVANGLDISDISTFEYRVLTSQTIAEVRTLPTGSTVQTSGIVTAVLGSAIYIQDETAGIVLYGSDLGLEVGDEVQAKGSLTEYSSLLEINVTKNDVTVLGKKTVPAANPVTADQLNEDKEGTLVTLKNITIESVSGLNFTAKDEYGTSFTIRPQDASLLTVGKTYDNITGVLGSYSNVYQLIPRNAEDIVEDESLVQSVIASPGGGFIKAGDTVSLSTATAGTTIYYTTDGQEPTTASHVYSQPIPINEALTIKAVAVKEGLSNSPVSTFEYKIQQGEVRIHDIQGATHDSPYKDTNVTDIEGIVTHVADANNFYMQDLQPDNDISTSEGILVYKKAHNVKVGDVVKVNGLVKEWVLEGYDEKLVTDAPVTEINASSIMITVSGQTLPDPVVIGKDRIAPTENIDDDKVTEFNPEQDGIDFYESLEGMRVAVENPKVVAPQQYGEVIVVPENVDTNTAAGGLKLTATDFNPERVHLDLNDETFVTKTGDSFNGTVAGVVSYGYSNYKVLTNKNQLPNLVEGNTVREVTSLEVDPDQLLVASYNVENFSTKTPDSKVQKIAESIITNLKRPDIIGLTEVQDNDGQTDSGTVDATESAKILIEKIKALGGPAYEYIDIAPEDKKDGGAPGGNIRVGFLYNPERVILTPGTSGSGTATQSVEYKEGKLTLNPGRIDPTNSAFTSSRKPLAAQFEFKGESVIVVASHFNSKGGDQPLFGKNQPPVLSSEVQRLQIAEIVNDFVKDIKAQDPDANVILTGDFNDFEFSAPLAKLKGTELTNMIEKVPFEQRYSYTYQGNSQVLDHILVSNNLADSTEVDIVHINSSFMEQHGRASDHDPVLIQTDLEEATVTPQKTYNFAGFTTKKLVVTKASLINLDHTSSITEGIVLQASATLKGEGLKNTKVTINPTEKDTIIDFSGTVVKEVFIENAVNIKEIKGSENVQKWTYAEGIEPTSTLFE